MTSLTVQNIDAAAVTLGVEFAVAKRGVLDMARAVTSVTDLASQETATQAASKVRALINQLEKDRQAVKAPVLEIGRKIDGVSKDAAADLIAELSRVEKLIKAFYVAQQEKARKAAETQRRFAEARYLREVEATQKASSKASAEREPPPTLPPIAVAAPPKAEKMTVRKVWRHRVTDLAALHAARPALTRVEPLTAAISAEIMAGMRECPGLEIWQDTEVIARS